MRTDQALRYRAARCSMFRYKPLGKRIRLLRDTRCWTQEQLASVAGYSIKTIWKAEACRPLKRQTLADIARALEVPIHEIAKLPPPLQPRQPAAQAHSMH